jgi:hypothetical protein
LSPKDEVCKSIPQFGNIRKDSSLNKLKDCVEAPLKQKSGNISEHAHVLKKDTRLRTAKSNDHVIAQAPAKALGKENHEVQKKKSPATNSFKQLNGFASLNQIKNQEISSERKTVTKRFSWNPDYVSPYAQRSITPSAKDIAKP